MAATRLWYLAAKMETTVATAVKPVNFLRFKEWDINPGLEILENDPIQNQRWKAINAVRGKESCEGSYKFDYDPNDAVFFLKAALGAATSADISSLTDGSVYKHTLTMANTLPALTIEQGKWNLSDSTSNLQNYQVDRAFGAMVDSFTLSASDGILAFEAKMIAHGIFQKANLISNATAGSAVDLALEKVEWLVAADSVNIYDETPQNEVDPIVSIDALARTVRIATLGASYTVAKRAKVELSPQTPSYSTLAKVMSFRHVRFQFGADLTAAASAAITNIEDRTFEYQNQLEARYGSLRASPSVIAPKGAIATLKYTVYFENRKDLDKFLNVQEQGCIITITNDEIVSATDTLQAKYTTVIKLNKLILKSYEMPTGTDELYAVSVEVSAFYSEADGKAIQMEITNSKIGTLYA